MGAAEFPLQAAMIAQACRGPMSAASSTVLRPEGQSIQVAACRGTPRSTATPYNPVLYLKHATRNTPHS
jgi:hypothetical protein